MRKTLLIGALCIATNAMSAVPRSIVVHTESGVATYSIENIRKLTFGTIQDNQMELHIKNSGTPVVFPYIQMQKVSFSEKSGVADVRETESNVNIAYEAMAQQLRITASESVRNIHVYDIRGNVVAICTPIDNEVNVSLSSLTPGVYVVRVMTASSIVTEKIVKR